MTTRVSQVAAEVLVHASLSARASQIVAEILIAAGLSGRVSQIVVEALIRLQNAGLPVRVSQIVAEILLWKQVLTTPPIYPTLPGLTFPLPKRPVFYNGKAVSGSGWNIGIGYAAAPTWEWDLTYDDGGDGGFLQDQPVSSELKQLLGFYLGMNGDLNRFLFLDPDDNTVVAQPIGVTDGATTLYTLARSYGSGVVGVEPIGYWNAGATFNVYLNGGSPISNTLYTVVTASPGKQQLSFITAPGTGQTITVDMSFYYYVHFKDPITQWDKFADKLWKQKTITLESLRG